MKTDEVFLNQTGLSVTQTVDAVEGEVGRRQTKIRNSVML